MASPSSIKPASPTHIAAQHMQAGKLLQAKAIYQQLLDEHPEHHEALFNMALILNQQGHHDEAINYYRKVLLITPDMLEALNNLGAIFYEQKKLSDALTCYQKALSLGYNSVELHNNIGNVLKDQGRLSEALSSYEKALTFHRGENAAVLCNLGEVYRGMNQHDEALTHFKKALRIQPDLAQAHWNAGNVFTDQGKMAEALSSHKKASALHHGENAAVLCNLGETYLSLNRFDEALVHFRRALHIQPDLIQAQWNLSLALLLLGNLTEGLPLYEKRFDIPHQKELLASGIGNVLEKFSGKPRWQGEDLHRKKLLVWTEQGAGDSLMMMRYLPLLKQKGAASVSVYCGLDLVNIMQTEADQVISNKAKVSLKTFDYHCSMMSLPYLLNTTLDSIPNDTPYITVPSTLKEKWGSQLSKIAGLKVGLAWAGSKNLKKDYLRSMPLQNLAPLMNLSGVQFINLQKGESSKQLTETNWRIFDWMDACEDFLDTAALIDNLDLVISVDTSVAHLAGALGKPVWLLNRFESEWRWMIDREDSPWYPSMRIFRQPQIHDWDSVIAKVATELQDLISEHARNLAPMSDQQWKQIVAETTHAFGKKKNWFARLWG